MPKRLRDALSLHPGTILEVEADAKGLHLFIPAQGCSLVRKDGFVLHHGGGKVHLNTVDFIREERETRSVPNHEGLL